MEFYKETKVAGGDCETPPGPTCRPGLGVLTTWPRVLGPQGLLGWALGKKGVPRKEMMGGHLLPSSVTGGPALEKPCAGSPSRGLQPPHLLSGKPTWTHRRTSWGYPAPHALGPGPHTVGP